MASNSFSRITAHLLKDEPENPRVRIENRYFRNFAVFYWHRTHVECMVRLSIKAKGEVLRILKEKGYNYTRLGRLVKIQVGDPVQVLNSLLPIVLLLGITSVKDMRIRCL